MIKINNLRLSKFFYFNRGERPPLNKLFEEIDSTLQFAYKFASKKIKKKSVLDFGCGGGYGTEYLSRFTNKIVVGFDIDKNTIEHCKVFFKNKKSVFFTSDKKKLKKYDVVTLFQVIEHLEKKDQEELLKEITFCYLKKKGMLIVSTVNKNITSYNLKKPIMPFHKYELKPEELEDLLKRHFFNVKLYGQIDSKIRDLLKKNNFNYYKEISFSFREKIIRFLSQIEIIRWIAKSLPVRIKKIIMRYKNERINYVLVKGKKYIDNSYIIIGIGNKPLNKKNDRNNFN